MIIEIGWFSEQKGSKEECSKLSERIQEITISIQSLSCTQLNSNEENFGPHFDNISINCWCGVSFVCEKSIHFKNKFSVIFLSLFSHRLEQCFSDIYNRRDYEYISNWIFKIFYCKEEGQNRSLGKCFPTCVPRYPEDDQLFK